MIKHPQLFLKGLTTAPGVYQMLDAQGHIIYVGKARNLRNRVKSYFQKNLGTRKTEVLMQLVDDIKIIVTGSENEALLLEANLIKRHHPRYNVLLRDDKSYPYLYLSTQDKFPRLDFHRGAKRLPGRYFGPYPNAGSVRENLALIQKLFKLRQCSDVFFANRTRPCLQYQIKRCTAPCVGYVSQQDYADQVASAILFLEGKNDLVMKQLVAQMEAASERLAYEEAAYFRDLITRFRKLQRQQFITSDQGNIDIIGAASRFGVVTVSVLFVRGGRLIGQKTFYPKVPIDTEVSSALAAFIPQYYLSPLRGEQPVERIILSEPLPEKKWIQAALRESFYKHLVISDRRLEQYRQWQMMVKANASFALTQHLAAKDNVAIKLEALQNALHLPNPITRIECFDVSHTLGEATVASCVVFGEEGPLKKEYRRFNIEGITPGDDYAALHQALTRRYSRLKTGDGTLPDLLMIDGGKGQLNQAIRALEEIQVSGVLLLGIAKGPSRKPGLEQLYLHGREGAIILKPDNLGLHLIQFVRDEAHRFAISAHRTKREKARTQSPLENIEGVGAKRRRALLQHFGGFQALLRASIVEIAKVPGISESLARKIYDALH